MCCSGLSEDDIKQKLEELRTTLQTDIFSEQMYDSNKKVLSKTAEIGEVKQKLESLRQEHDKLGETVQADIAQKTSYVEQVNGTHAQVHAHAHIGLHSISFTCDDNASDCANLLCDPQASIVAKYCACFKHTANALHFVVHNST